MKILHVCIKDGQISTEITDEGVAPMFSPITTCEQYFQVKIDSPYVTPTRERRTSSMVLLAETYKNFVGSLLDQGFKIVPPAKPDK